MTTSAQRAAAVKIRASASAPHKEACCCNDNNLDKQRISPLSSDSSTQLSGGLQQIKTKDRKLQKSIK